MAGRHRERPGVNPPAPQAGGVPKVPAVGAYFWLVKLLTTAMGEAVSDFLVQRFNPYLAVLATMVVFAAAIAWQFRVAAYRTWPYWTAVAMVAVFGTMVADAIHIGLGVPYKVSALLFAVVLTVILVTWYRSEGTLSIHSIRTPRREFFYWATVCATFAMGTAVGDLTAQKLHWGYLLSGIVFTAAILVVYGLWRAGLSPVLTFWAAYILTRPVGASFADFFGMPVKSGGLGVGHATVSAVTLLLVLGSFWYLARTGVDAPVVDAARAVTAHAGDEASPRLADTGYAQQGYGAPQYGAPQYGAPQHGSGPS
jgi:uncharacterized membrane-anchored protein